MGNANNEVLVEYGCFHHPDKAKKGERRMVTFEKAAELVRTKHAKIRGGPGEDALRRHLNPENAMIEAPEDMATRSGPGLTTETVKGNKKGKRDKDQVGESDAGNLGAADTSQSGDG